MRRMRPLHLPTTTSFKMVIHVFLSWANFTHPVFRANTGGTNYGKCGPGVLPLSLPISSGFMLKRKRASLIGLEIVIYVPLLKPVKRLDYRCYSGSVPSLTVSVVTEDCQTGCMDVLFRYVPMTNDTCFMSGVILPR